MESRKSVVIIGGGLAGLTAAAYSARSGASTTLYERSSQLGGMAATEESNGFRFNMGPHAFYRGGVGEEVVFELGVPWPGRVPVADRGARAGELHVLPTDATSLLKTRLFGAKAKLELGIFLAGLAKMETAPLDHTTLADWAAERFRQPASREFFLAVTRVSSYTNDPGQMSAGAALAQLQHAAAPGVIYLDNGWQSLVAGLRQAAEAAGARIVTGARVESVRPGSRAEIHLAGGEVRSADAVIVAASPQVARDLVSGGASNALGAWARDAVPVRAACLDVALRRLPVPKRPFALGIDEPTYLSLHSVPSGMAPEGMALLSLQKYLPTDDHDAALAEAQLERLLDLVQPGWRAQLVERRFLPNMIVSHWLPLAASGGLAGRPGPDVPGAEGVFVAGDWVGGEGMLSEAAFASGRQAARLALARVSPRTAATADKVEATPREPAGVRIAS